MSKRQWAAYFTSQALDALKGCEVRLGTWFAARALLALLEPPARTRKRYLERS